MNEQAVNRPPGVGGDRAVWAGAAWVRRVTPRVAQVFLAMALVLSVRAQAPVPASAASACAVLLAAPVARCAA